MFRKKSRAVPSSSSSRSLEHPVLDAREYRPCNNGDGVSAANDASSDTFNIPLGSSKESKSATTTASIERDFDSPTPQSKVLESPSKPLDNFGTDPKNYPEGGYGWVVVACCFMLEAFTEGPMAAFGVYQEHYMNHMFKGQVSNSTISFIGSLAPASMSLCGLFGGKLCERFGFKVVPIVGVVIITLGYLLASFSTKPWHLFLTQGLMTGIGASLAFLPSVSTPSQWFYKRRGLATGFVVTGVGAGGMLWSLLTRFMITRVGAQWSLRITAIMEFVVGIACVLLIKTRFADGRPQVLEWNTFRDPRLWGILGFFALASLSALIPLYYLPGYATSHGLSSSTGALLVSIGNLSSTLGRLITSVISDYVGSANIAMLGPFASSLAILCIWTVAAKPFSMMLFAICYGFGYGTIYTQTPVVISRLFGKLQAVARLLPP
ncbi:hypothetical protein EV182_003989 [Spiromyces aspiralis]|uniref:Uncharacterized protein n=1 Tax=Spiromyces aspiralis TaxID=68401 RepID=A0ACC1HED7_9FUNG|nr:hypothetical protein EV182_003989 [Spiromyces aspiralis]